MFKKYSGVKLSGDKEIMCNNCNEESYIKDLKNGDSFYIQSAGTFSIENAIVLRDWLDEMIDIATFSGYFNRKEMTIEAIEEELGYKIKIISTKC